MKPRFLSANGWRHRAWMVRPDGTAGGAMDGVERGFAILGTTSFIVCLSCTIWLLML